MRARALPWRTLVPALLLLLLACAVGRTSSDETESHSSVQDAKNGFAGELFALGQRLSESGNWQDALRAMLAVARLAREEGSARLSFDVLRAAAQVHLAVAGEAKNGPVADYHMEVPSPVRTSSNSVQVSLTQ
ncbi:hypothetical protein T484DRAFT_2216916 [Baffinella frigidus]|nr:hypothetical protein T484DRAFT_2216916 [Cryptophyta sp. CCMP2293]